MVLIISGVALIFGIIALALSKFAEKTHPNDYIWLDAIGNILCVVSIALGFIVGGFLLKDYETVNIYSINKYEVIVTKVPPPVYKVYVNIMSTQEVFISDKAYDYIAADTVTQVRILRTYNSYGLQLENTLMPLNGFVNQ